MSPVYRRWKSRLFLGLMGLALLVCLVPLASLLLTLVVKGGHVISLRFLTAGWQPVGERGGGIAHAIAGSLYLLGVATLIAAPLGLAKGLFLARGDRHWLTGPVRVLLDVMSGIPAIIVGVFVYTLVVRRGGFSLGTGFSLLAGGLALAMIMLPIFARTTEEAVRAIPPSVDEAGLALGLPRRRVVLWIVLRSAVPAVLTGLFLALARVAGEAAPLLFTAFGSNAFPGSPLEPAGSLPQLLFEYARQPFEELVRQAWGAALVLVAMILAVRLLTHAYTRWRYGGHGGHA
ncbi:MAG: phosphate ABC transporter permease PstA [Phycisphaerae bacterium]|nr:phosphate ABC transporter permease PstA [Phycisphaerae bacterium]